MELKHDGICAVVVVPPEYWKSQGPVPVIFTGKFTEPPSQIVVPPVMIAVGAGKIVSVIGRPELLQPDALVKTVRTLLYEPAATVPGTVIETGELVNVAPAISPKPAFSAIRSKLISY